MVDTRLRGAQPVGMCNLYKMDKSAAEVARLFGVTNAADNPNTSELVFPGYPGLVVAQGQARVMHWGFPLPQKSRKTGEPIKPKAVTNTRDDKLSSPFWRDSFARRRCLIPAAAFAEAEGAAGSMTRTWLSVPGAELFAIAGIWRESDEWGNVYSMVTCAPSSQTADIHDRMPVVLPVTDHEQWTSGSAEEAIALCRPYPDLLDIERTSEAWVRR